MPLSYFQNNITNTNPEYFPFDKMHPSTNIQVCTLLPQTYFHMSFCFVSTLFYLVSSLRSRLLAAQRLSAVAHGALMLLLPPVVSLAAPQMVLHAPLRNRREAGMRTAPGTSVPTLSDTPGHIM